MNKIQPAYIKKGDKIAVVACARKVSVEEIGDAVDVFKSWGLEVVLGKNLFNKQDQFSGSDAERADDLQNMFDDHSIKAVICARGGYGTVRIVDKIDFTTFRQHPKWMIGFSDITVLHSHIHSLGIESLHAKMLMNINKDKESTETLRKALFGETLNYEVQANLLNKNGEAEGLLVGGNLSLIYSLAGSVSDLETNGKILFLEDLDEYLYHIDRMMMSLKRSGKLDHLAGLVIGGMTDMKDNAIPFGKTAEEIIIDTVKEYNYPVCFDFPAGHIDRNLALYFGKKVKLTVNDKGGSLLY